MFAKDFKGSYYSAYTLDVSEVCPCGSTNIKNACHCTRTIAERTHDDGWTISGYVREDYSTWVKEFEATHPIFGKVFGNFEDIVYADSEEGFNDFFSKHTPHAWDYGDI